MCPYGHFCYFLYHYLYHVYLAHVCIFIGISITKSIVTKLQNSYKVHKNVPIETH